MHLSGMATAAHQGPSAGKRSRYLPPEETREILLPDLLKRIGRAASERRQTELLKREGRDLLIRYSGDISLLDRPAVSIVGTREVSEAGRMRASRLSRELASAGVVVVSGLAKGVDAAAHRSAIQAGGATVAVIGTPLTKAYPAENTNLQEEIYRSHLLLTPFGPEDLVLKGNFPTRNKVMAAVTSATVIIEASDTSGTLHQATECHKLNRWLFILRSVVDNRDVSWPSRFLNHPKTVVLDRTEDVLDRVRGACA